MANPSFASLGDFALAVRNAAETNYQHLDRRLIRAAAPSTVSKEAVGADGGYLVPPDVRSDVVRGVLSETSLLALTDRQTLSSNSIVVPVDASPAWSASGPQTDINPEGVAIAQSKLSVQSRTVRLTRIDVLLPVSGEVLEDAPGLTAYLKATVPDRLTYKINDHLINGDGVEKCLGLLSYPCKLVQTKESGQTTGTINFANVSKMWSRLYAPSKARAVWLCHSDAEAQLQNMVSPVGAPALVYWPGEPFPRLFGRPVLVTEACQVPGTEGDIVLVDPLGMLTATREGITRQDFSIHLWFDNDLGAFKFTTRLGAANWWSAALSRAHGSSTVSTVVTVEAR
jgi:HK97 family phage major capsid protein